MIAEFLREHIGRGIVKVQPRFYLSTEWGVPFDTISIAIPFYLARLDLTDFHAERGGLVEGASRSDVLRYLRHEMGHVVNYAYRLYERPDWTEQFGDINLPYEEEYRPRPFSLHYVDHLPGWYAQKHPDEDWAETFAVWMTPGLDRARRPLRRSAGDGQAGVLRPHNGEELCGRDPLVTAEHPDEDERSGSPPRWMNSSPCLCWNWRPCLPTWTTPCKRSSMIPAGVTMRRRPTDPPPRLSVG